MHTFCNFVKPGGQVPSLAPLPDAHGPCQEKFGAPTKKFDGSHSFFTPFSSTGSHFSRGLGTVDFQNFFRGHSFFTPFLSPGQANIFRGE